MKLSSVLSRAALAAASFSASEVVARAGVVEYTSNILQDYKLVTVFQVGSPWVVTPSNGQGSTVSSYPAGGNAWGFGGTIPNADSIEQTDGTIVGVIYTLTVKVANANSPFSPIVSNGFTASENGVTLILLANLPSQNFQEYSTSFTATSTNTDFKFSGYNGQAETTFADPSVTAPQSPVPEPGLFVPIGLAFFGMLRRRHEGTREVVAAFTAAARQVAGDLVEKGGELIGRVSNTMARLMSSGKTPNEESARKGLLARTVCRVRAAASTNVGVTS